MNALAYAAACVIVPSLWAVLAFFVFGWLDRRRAGAVSGPAGTSSGPSDPRDDDLPPADYQI